jgi:hypothetical protein
MKQKENVEINFEYSLDTQCLIKNNNKINNFLLLMFY